MSRAGSLVKGHVGRLPELLAVAGWLAGNLFVFGTHSTYAGNRDLFSVPFSFLLERYYLHPLALLVLGLLGVGLLLPGRGLYRVYLVTLFGVGLMTWVQGNFLVWNYGAFDGTAIDFASHRLAGGLEVVLWISVLSLLLIYRERAHRHLVFVAGGLCLLQAVAILPLRSGQAAAKAVKQRHPSGMPLVTSRPDSVFEFSRAGNVIIYISDGFESDIFREIVDGPDGFAADLDGFTFFDDTSTNARVTIGAYPALISGSMYDGTVPFRTYAQETVGRDNIGRALYRAGYSVAFVLESGNLQFQREHCVSPFLFLKQFSADDLASRRVLNATLFRHVPHLLKPYVFDGTSGVAARLLNDPIHMMDVNGTTAYVDFMNLMNLRMTARGGPPTFKLFHLLNAHPPISLNERCEYERMTMRRKDWVRTNVCSMKMFARFLAHLKALGVYDKSTIVFLGDHGAKGSDTGITAVTKGLSVADAWPALAIKPPGSHGPLRASSVPAELSDVPATIAALTGIGDRFPGRSVFSLRAGEKRERYFFLGAFRERWDKTVDTLPHRVDFAIRGPVRDRSSWFPLVDDTASTGG